MTTLALLLWLSAAPKDATVGERWDFDGVTASVSAKGDPRDSLSNLALEKLGLKLEGPLSLKASAHPNTVGGVTLRLEDPSDAKAYCDLYASRDGEALRFSDSRCSFPAFSGRLRTEATCRKISGTARKLDDGKLALEARSPDCNAAPLGLPLSVSGTLTPR
jgi:hypothetical protein